MGKTKKVFVSGCYDLLHSGHVAFFEEASSHGDLYVGLGSDKTVYELKGRSTINNEQERLYMVRALRMVKEAWINSGRGLMDFEKEATDLKPDIFFVNEEGYTYEKQAFCERYGIELIVSKRIPSVGLPVRSTTALRKACDIPYRLDLAGGWLDQPFVSEHCKGPVITIGIEPDLEFNDRSGMASSTRAKAIEMWQNRLPEDDREKLARMLFSYENPPGSKYVSGSQDSIGIVYPGLNRLDYQKGEYWPARITSVTDEDTLQFIEKHLWFINLSPREGDYSVLTETTISEPGARELADAADEAWSAIVTGDLAGFGKAFRRSFEAQVAMFPLMVNKKIVKQIDNYKDKALGWKISGAGGGGYLVIVSALAIKNAFQIRIRRGD
ncbi:adenylyltransferase/cytidyltransferase family protein [Bacteroidota bacterium]